MKSYRLFLAASFAILLPFSAFCEAPVVDDSENFAMLDDQQAAYERPVAREQIDSDYNDEETALANDTADTGRPARISSTGSNTELLDKLQGLQQDIQELRGQLEVQAHDLKLLQEQQMAFYRDLDSRIRQEGAQAANVAPTSPLSVDNTKAAQKLAAPIAPVAAVAAPSLSKPKSDAIVPANTTTSNNPADEQISYLAAYELVKNKQYDQALVAMQNFVTRYPQGGYTANAQYWLGELYMVKKDYQQAIAHFDIVLQQFPSSSKSSASNLKIGYALAESGRRSEAKTRLQQVVKSYPDTNIAHLAAAKLATLES